MSAILTAENLAKSFGNVRAVASVSLEIHPGELLGVLGPNGSGKTTLFNLLTGVFPPDSGRILFNGVDITGATAHKRCRMGIGRTYQIPRPFGDMTVLENLLVAATHGGGMSEKAARTEAGEILDETGLSAVRHDFARTLPLLSRKRLEMARALATKPTLLLLDEVAGGLNETEARQVLAMVKKMQHKGITVVWIEHILTMMADVDRILALDQGRNIVCGNPAEVMSCKEVLECYLGAEADE